PTVSLVPPSISCICLSSPSVASPCLFVFYSAAHHRDLPSFPTRRSSDLAVPRPGPSRHQRALAGVRRARADRRRHGRQRELVVLDRKSTRLNSSHVSISYAVFCLKKKTTIDATARVSE